MNATTKKMLAAIDLGQRNTPLGEFLVPTVDKTAENGFIGIDSGKPAEFGAVSYTGKDLTAELLFARFVESGAKILDVDHVVQCFTEYLRQIKTFRVGNVLAIHYTGNSFELSLVQKRPP